MKIEREDFTLAALSRIERYGSQANHGALTKGAYDVYRTLWEALPPAPFVVTTGTRIRASDGKWEFEVGHMPLPADDNTNLPARYTEHRGGDASHKRAFLISTANIKRRVRTGTWVVVS